MASEKQAAHLEKAREERNKHQALLTQIKSLEAELEAHKVVGAIFHDDTFSWLLHNERTTSLRNTWPDLYEKLTELYGKTTKEGMEIW